MLHRTLPPSRDLDVPLRRRRVVIEDERLAASHYQPAHALALDVAVCSGPIGPDDGCPLVGSGNCPLGPCDAVVCGLAGPLGATVRAAWRGVGVALTEPPEVEFGKDAGARLDGFVGAALVAMFGPHVPQFGGSCD